jgi:ATP-dependent DNA ligase
MDSKIYNQEFPEIYEALEKLLHKSVVLDGEIVAVEPSGSPDFNALQNRRHKNRAAEILGISRGQSKT